MHLNQLPGNYHHKIQFVPSTPKVGALTRKQAETNNFNPTFKCKASSEKKLGFVHKIIAERTDTTYTRYRLTSSINHGVIRERQNKRIQKYKRQDESVKPLEVHQLQACKPKRVTKR
jgi:hypothetical protein